MKILVIKAIYIEIAVVVLIGVVAIAVILFVHMPLVLQIRQNQQEGYVLVGEVEVIREGLSFLSEGSLALKIASRDDISRVMSAITKLGRKYKLNFLSINPGEIIAGDRYGYDRLPVSMSISSEYKKLGSFFGEIGVLSAGVIRVEKFSILASS